MTRRLFALAIALLVTGVAARADNTGLEALTRPEKLFGWEGVGRVDLGGGGFCTGTLIATDLVLTAAHCVFDAEGAPQPLAGMVFRAGLSQGTAIAEVAVQRLVAHPGYVPGRGPNAQNVRNDVALLVLQTPVPAVTADPFRVGLPGARREVSVVSYAHDRAEALSWQRRCTVNQHRAELLAFDCDVTFGSSGAPVFDLSSGRAVIVSIVSAGQQYADHTVAFGMELPQRIADLKAALRSGRGVRSQEVSRGAADPGIRRLRVGHRNTASGARFLKP